MGGQWHNQLPPTSSNIFTIKYNYYLPPLLPPPPPPLLLDGADS